MTTKQSQAEPKWYEKPMRICALQTSERSPGVDAIKTWKGAGFNVEQLLHAIGDGYFAAFDPKRHGDTLRAYLAEAHRREMRVILYLNTHTLSPLAPETYDEWGGLTQGGEPWTGYGTFRMGCVNSGWADALIESTRQACRLGIDGIFSDGPVAGCYCPKCRALFAAAYGPLDVTGPQYAEFSNRSLLNFVRRLHETIKQENEEILFYQNLDVQDAGAIDFVPYNDIVGSEGGFMFYGPPRDGYLWRPSLTAKRLEAVAEGKPTVIFAAADQKPWSRYLHAPAETRLLFASSIASGANLWYGLHLPLDEFIGPSADAATGMCRFMAANERWYDATVSAARVALLHSETSAKLYNSSGEASDFYAGQGGTAIRGDGDLLASMNGFAAMLYRSQIPFDIVLESAGAEWLARYDCIVLPTTPCLSDSVIEKLRQYVAAGGNLISCFDVALFDDAGNKRRDFGLGDVIGARFLEESWTFHNVDYFSIEDSASNVFAGIQNRLIPAPGHAFKVEASSATVLARFHQPMSGPYVELSLKTTPAILFNDYGKGRSLYLAATFGEFYARYAAPEHKRIVANAIAAFSRPGLTVENAPESLEVSHRRKRDGSADIVHLVNYTGGMSRPISEVVPLSNLQLRVRGSGRVASAKSLATGDELEYMVVSPNEIEIAVPEMREYEVIVLEWL